MINIFGQLHNANIGEYVVATDEVYDKRLQHTLEDFNSYIDGCVTYNGIYMSICPSSYRMTPYGNIALSVSLYSNGVDITDKASNIHILRYKGDDTWSGAKIIKDNCYTIIPEDMTGDVTNFFIYADYNNFTYACKITLTRDYSWFQVCQSDELAIPYHDKVLVDWTCGTTLNIYIDGNKLTPGYVSLELPNDNIQIIDNNIVLSYKLGYVITDTAFNVIVGGTYNGFTYRIKKTVFIKLTRLTCYTILPSAYKIYNNGGYNPSVYSVDVVSTFNDLILKNCGDYVLKYIIDDADEQIYNGELDLSSIKPKQSIVFTLYHNDIVLDYKYIPVSSPSEYRICTNIDTLDNEDTDDVNIYAERLMVIDGSAVSTDYGYLLYSIDGGLKQIYSTPISLSDIDNKIEFFFLDNEENVIVKKKVAYNSIVIDNELDESSNNAVSNSVITLKLNELINRISALENKV